MLCSVGDGELVLASDPTRESRHDFPSSRPGRTLLFLVISLHPGHVKDLTSAVKFEFLSFVNFETVKFEISFAKSMNK